MANDRHLLAKVLVDILIVLAVTGTSTILICFLKPYRRGYFLEDQTIRLPLKSNTVPFWLLIVVAIGITTLTVIVTEKIRNKHKERKNQYILNCRIPRWLWESFIVLMTGAFGVECQRLTVEIAKLVIGRLRPHFFEVCRPVPFGAPGPHEYIINYTCTFTDSRNIRKSFPSGHSAFAMYAAVFLNVYIQHRVTWCCPKLMRHAFQFLFLLLAWYVCLSRVSDNMHHWDDVACGMLLGVVFAVLTWSYVWKSFKSNPSISLSTEDDPAAKPMISPIIP